MRSAHWDVAARTHPGHERARNEDSFVCDARRGRFAVIDGMGGRAAGIVAAQLTRQALLEGSDDVSAAIQRANQRVRANVVAHPERAGMGCVVTAVDIDGDVLDVGHVGDTRAYLASAAGAEQLTQDHTAKAVEQEARGLSDAQALELPVQHAVTNDVGGRAQADCSWIQRIRAPFERGDLLLLCSDGLHDLVPSHELFGLLARARKARTCAADLCDHLLQMALCRGGTDNVTVVAIRRRHPAGQLVTALGNLASLGDGSLPPGGR